MPAAAHGKALKLKLWATQKEWPAERRRGGGCLRAARTALGRGAALERERTLVDGHRCEGRSFEVRAHNWGARGGPGKELREFVNLATKEITGLFVQTSNQNTALSVAVNEPTMVLVAGTWSPVEAARAFPSLLISRRQLEVPLSLRHLEIPAGIRRALGKPVRRPSHLCFASSDRCCTSPGFLCDPPHNSSLPKPPQRGPGGLLHTGARAQRREDTARAASAPRRACRGWRRGW